MPVTAAAPADMTLGEATDLLTNGGLPCACSGPWPVCHCARRWIEAAALKRVAHIAAKQVAELRGRVA